MDIARVYFVGAQAHTDSLRQCRANVWGAWNAAAITSNTPVAHTNTYSRFRARHKDSRFIVFTHRRSKCGGLLCYRNTYSYTHSNVRATNVREHFYRRRANNSIIMRCCFVHPYILAGVHNLGQRTYICIYENYMHIDGYTSTWTHASISVANLTSNPQHSNIGNEWCGYDVFSRQKSNTILCVIFGYSLECCAHKERSRCRSKIVRIVRLTRSSFELYTWVD